MLETRAIVVQVDGQCALVQADQGNGCGQCNGKGCGTSKLSKLFCSKPRQFQVDNPIKANVGDEVIVSIAKGVVLRGIGLVYALPLLLLLAGAMLGNFLVKYPAMRDGHAAVGALCGLVVGFVVAKWILSRAGHPKPYIARQWRNEQS